MVMEKDDLIYLLKVNARDAFYGYFEPLKVVVAFFAIPTEMMRQAFISLSMDSVSFKNLQQLKEEEEEEELVAQGSHENVEK
jgi:hypothetical protein